MKEEEGEKEEEYIVTLADARCTQTARVRCAPMSPTDTPHLQRCLLTSRGPMHSALLSTGGAEGRGYELIISRLTPAVRPANLNPFALLTR